jgi:hypothetical protein
MPLRALCIGPAEHLGELILRELRFERGHVDRADTLALHVRALLRPVQDDGRQNRPQVVARGDLQRGAVVRRAVLPSARPILGTRESHRATQERDHTRRSAGAGAPPRCARKLAILHEIGPLAAPTGCAAPKVAATTRGKGENAHLAPIHVRQGSLRLAGEARAAELLRRPLRAWQAAPGKAASQHRPPERRA